MIVGMNEYRHEAGECFTRNIATLKGWCGDPRCKEAKPKHRVKSVTIEWSENRYFQTTLKSEPQRFDTLEEASSLLCKLAHHATDLGYDKTDFVVVFDDGYEYRGRYDLHKSGDQQEHRNGNTPNLRQHILDHCEFYAGRWIPSHFQDRVSQYNELIADHKDAYAAFLDEYEV